MRTYSSHQFILALAISLFGLASCGSSPQAYVEKGNQFFAKNKLEDAEIQYQKAIQKSPKFGEAHYRLALLDLRRNQLGPGYRELLRAHELMPENVEITARLGQLALAIYSNDRQHPKQLYDQAAKATADLMAKDANGFDANRLQAALDMVARKPADAIIHLRKALEKNSKDLDTQLGLARALVQNGQTTEGLEVANALIHGNKAFGPAYDFVYEMDRSLHKDEEAGELLKLKVANNPKQAAYILELGRHFVSIHKPEEVTATMQKILGNPADFPDGRLIVGDFYASVAQPEEALTQFEKGLATDKKNDLAYRKRILRIRAGQRKWADALAEAEVILKAHPDDQETKLARALVWLEEGNPANLDSTIAELRAQSKARPNDPAIHYNLGTAVARKNDLDGARTEWTAAARLNKSYSAPRYSLAQLNLAQNKPKEALPLAEDIVAIEPRNPEAHLLLSACLTYAGEYQRARAELNRLSEAFPKSPQVRFRLGLLDLSEGKYKDAEEIFRHFDGSAADDPGVLTGLAQAYQGQKESAKAIQLLEDELKRKPDSPLIRRTLAQFALAAKSYDVAIQQYQQLAESNPKALDFQISLASAYLSKGDIPAALGVLQKATQADPKSAAAQLALAQTFVMGSRVNEAKTAYRRVLELQPTNASALNDLAYLMADTGESLDEALALAQRGLQNATAPTLKTSLSDTLGWIYLKKKMNDSALQTFQTLVRTNPGSMTYRYHLGVALYQKGDNQRARTELEAALATKPASADEPKIRELLAQLQRRS